MDIEKLRKIVNNSSTVAEMPVRLKGFNWGAFLLTFIWGIWYKAWITLLAIPLMWFQLPLGLNWFLLLGLQIYCGIMGNEWAYRVDYKKSDYDFKMAQIKWAIFGFSLQLVIPMIFIFIFCLFVFKSPENPVDFAVNAQCKVAYDNLKKGLYKVNLNSTENEMANEFAKQFKDSKADVNSVNFSLSSQGQVVDLYYIRFIKTGENFCELKNQNCKVESGFLLPEEIFSGAGECVFYLDKYKRIYPTEQTLKNIKKSYNVFKYLY